MQTIKNKTSSPVKAVDYAGVKKLVDEGSIEILGHVDSSQTLVTDNRGPRPRSGGGPSHSTSGGHSTGDR